MTQGPHLPGSLGNIWDFFNRGVSQAMCNAQNLGRFRLPSSWKNDHSIGIYVAMVAMDFQYDQYGMTLPPKNHHIPSNLTMAHIIIIIVSTRCGNFPLAPHVFAKGQGSSASKGEKCHHGPWTTFAQVIDCAG